MSLILPKKLEHFFNLEQRTVQASRNIKQWPSYIAKEIEKTVKAFALVSSAAYAITVARRRREIGFSEAFNESTPEVAIVGDSHAQRLKKQRPDQLYVRLVANNWAEYYLNFLSGLFGVKPDRLIWLSGEAKPS